METHTTEGMSESTDKVVFFHVGTGKTGTTFLQYRVFPKLKNVRYIQRTRYNKAAQIITRSSDTRFLVSREFDQQLKVEVEKFAARFPNATPIIVFRRHDSYIASQCRRFVKNGFNGSFKAFFDLDGDSGYFKKEDLDYRRMLNILEQNFTKRPLVFIYENMKDDPRAFISSMAKSIGAEVDLNDIDLSFKHASYSEQQLKAMQRLSRVVDMRKRRVFRNPILHLLWRLGLGSLRYSTLFIAKWLPSSWFGREPLISKQELESVRAEYEQDWNYVNSYSTAETA